MTAWPWPRGRRGFLLPLALLLLLAISGLGVATLAVARTEALMERGDLHYLRERVRWEASAPWSSPGEEDTREEGRMPADLHVLGGGFRLLRAGADPSPAAMTVVWVLEPDSVAASLPAAAEVGWGTPDPRIETGAEGCGPPPPGAAVRVRSGPGAPPADPPLDPPPRLGPVGVAGVAARAGSRISSGEPIPATEGPAVVEAAGGGRLDVGRGNGLLLSPGSLVLAGEARWTGLVMVTGDLTLEEEAVLEGVALVGGRLRLRDDARLVGCRAAVARGLQAPELAPPFPVPGGRLLGRF